MQAQLVQLKEQNRLLREARANVDRYLAMKNFTRIVAPFDGSVTARNTDVGSLINAGTAAGQELFVVSDTRRLRAYVNVPQTYVPDVRPTFVMDITAQFEKKLKAILCYSSQFSPRQDMQNLFAELFGKK